MMNKGLPLVRTVKREGDHEITTPELRLWLAKQRRVETARKELLS